MSDLISWRRRFETTLTEEYGWLTLAGLFWFDEGSFTLGGAPDNDFVPTPIPCCRPGSAGWSSPPAG